MGWSLAHKGQKPWNLGKSGYTKSPHTDETKQKIKDSWVRRKNKTSIDRLPELEQSTVDVDLSSA